jgi:hypothetical protein
MPLRLEETHLDRPEHQAKLQAQEKFVRVSQTRLLTYLIPCLVGVQYLPMYNVLE